jgi:polysaccharide chain length determinant protein (PEP-CTERM system associated)
MTAEESGGDIQRIIEVAWRRKWVILIPFVIISISITLWGLYLPNLYMSTASIFIEPQKVPTEYVRSTVTSDLEARLRTVTQQMTSRTRILRVIDELDLYPDMRAAKVPSEVLVAHMRNNLIIETPTRRGSADYFQMSFIHPEPNKAMLAVSKLISLFIEESLQIREQQAEGTTIFIEEELAKLKVVLEEQEADIQAYKQRYMGELPNQLDANLRMLDNLQMQLSNNLESQRETDDRIMLLEREISHLEGEMRVASTVVNENETETVTNTTLNELLNQRDAQRQRVTSLEVIYTDRHPDLIAARKEIVRLDEQIRVVTENLSISRESGEIPTVVAQTPAYSSEITNLRRQLNEMKPRLSALLAEEKDLKKHISRYQKRIEAAPRREQHLLQLTRDYENTKASYEDLLNKKLEAQLSENLEKRQKGENFQILDPANYPEKPFLPNRKKIITMGLLSGLGIGVGFAILLEILFPVFYSLRQLRTLGGFDIVLGIPYITSSLERRQKESWIFIGAGITVLTFVVVSLLIDRYVADLGQIFSTIGNNLKGIM